MPKIVGYSERGRVNALFESVLASRDPVGALSRLLATATLVENKYSVVKFRPGGRIRDFHVFIEPSLSDFGCPDAIIVLDRETEFPNAPSKLAIFVEAKVCSFEESAQGNPELTKNSSGILHELFLKACFARELLQARLEGRPEPFPLEGIHVYVGDGMRIRTIGRDPVVRAVVDALADCEFQFFALTTDRGHPASPVGGLFETGTRIGDHMRAICAENERPAQRGDHTWSSTWWEELAYVWSWHDVRAAAGALIAEGDSAFRRLSGSIEWNRSKFLFPACSAPDTVAAFRDFLERHGLNERARENRRDRRTVHRGGRAVFTCRVQDSFEGPVLDAYLLLADDRREWVRLPIESLRVDVDGLIGNGPLLKLIEHVQSMPALA